MKQFSVEVTGQDPESIQSNLTAAVEAIRSRATSTDARGIMITQHGFDLFTVSLSSNVPYGQTREQRNFSKPRYRDHTE